MNRLERLFDRLRIEKKFHKALTWFFNSGFFYLGWILAIKYASEGLFLRGPIICAVLIALHLLFTKDSLYELCLVVTISSFGILVDTSLSLASIINYHGGFPAFHHLAPPWVTMLWGLFATSLNHSFSWMDRRLYLSIPFGACGGTLTYLAAIKAGAADLLVSTEQGVAILMVLWGVIFPLSFVYNRLLHRLWTRGLTP